MVILVDMDDVLERLVPGWVAYINERFGTNTVPGDVKDWDMSLAFPGLTHEQVYSAVDDPALWDYVGPMPGAYEGLRALIDRGHDVFVVTASDYPTIRVKMENVLFRYFPYITWDRVILTKHKEMIRGDVIIDDGPHNLTRSVRYRLLYDASHNRAFDEKSADAVRVYGWEDIVRVIDRIAENEARQPDRGGEAYDGSFDR